MSPRIRRRAKPRIESPPRSVFLLIAMVLGLALDAEGQITNANQIEGTVAFTNTDPMILSLFDPNGPDEGFQNILVTANSIGVSPPFSNSTGPAATTSTGGPYEISVESGPPGDGIPYDVIAEVRLDSGRDRYLFVPKVSAPVVEENAPNIVVDFSECASLLHIRFVNSADDPVAVTGGSIQAFRETSPGSGTFELQANNLGRPRGTPEGATEQYLAVRGDGSNYKVEIFFDVGIDQFCDKIRFFHETIVQVGCDQIVDLPCLVPEVGELGEIIGVLDMLGEDENREGDFPTMFAERGPFGNRRVDTIEPTAPGEPAEGPFLLKNLVPSDATTPPSDYLVLGAMSFRRGRRYEFLQTPFLIGQNGLVPVSANQTVNLENTFVLDPGFVRGEIVLAGPPPSPFSCLQDILRDIQIDGLPITPGLGNSSHIHARGWDIQATGASKTALGGSARVHFEGEYNPDPDVAAFQGDYELVLGGLLGERSIWRAPELLSLLLVDVATPEIPESYLSSRINIRDRDAPLLEVVPGETTEADVRYCFGRLNLRFRSTETDFFQPNVLASGNFEGLDFESNPVRYSVSPASATGTPVGEENAAREGLVVLCIPEGSYSFSPFVTTVNPGGGTSSTQLPPLTGIEVECGRIHNVSLGLQVRLDPLPSCTDVDIVTLTGSALGTGEGPAEVEEIFAIVNGGSPSPFCTGCGEDPSFQFDVPLEECQNEIEVTAIDVEGRVSSIVSTVRFDSVEPEFTDCQAIHVECDPDSSGAVVAFEITAVDNCDGTVPVTSDPPSGSFFPLGSTEVLCTSVDDCGNLGICSFLVTVTDSVAPEIFCPDDLEVECTGPGGTTVEFSVSASDNCGIAPQLESSPPSGSLFPLGATRVDCTATDLSGNAATCSFFVTVTDSVAPELSCPDDIVVEVSDVLEPVFFSLEATDLCDSNPVVLSSPRSGSRFPPGETSVLCLALDASGNQTVREFKVTINATVDFDRDKNGPLPDQTFIETRYEELGVRIAGVSDQGIEGALARTQGPIGSSTDDMVPATAPNYLQTFSGAEDSDSGRLQFEFFDPSTGNPRPVSFVELTFLDIEDSGLGPEGRGVSSLSAIDALGETLEQVLIPVGEDGGHFTATIGERLGSLEISSATARVGDLDDSGGVDRLAFLPRPSPVTARLLGDGPDVVAGKHLSLFLWTHNDTGASLPVEFTLRGTVRLDRPGHNIVGPESAVLRAELDLMEDPSIYSIPIPADKPNLWGRTIHFVATYSDASTGAVIAETVFSVVLRPPA